MTWGEANTGDEMTHTLRLTIVGRLGLAAVGLFLFVVSLPQNAFGEVFRLRMRDQLEYPFIKIGGRGGHELRDAVLYFHREDAAEFIRQELIEFFACEALVMGQKGKTEFIFRKAQRFPSMDTELPRGMLLVQLRPDNLLELLNSISGGAGGGKPPSVLTGIGSGSSGGSDEGGNGDRRHRCKLSSVCVSPKEKKNEQTKQTEISLQASASVQCGPLKVTFNSDGDLKFDIKAGPISVSLGP